MKSKSKISIENSLTSLDVLGDKGLLSASINNFTPRSAQLVMTEAIEKAISLNAKLVVEAGTGTGKSYGYLVPIFLSQKKTIISTGTKNLQDQLFFNDIPIIKKALNSSLKVILLKGRANYLCLHRLKRNLEEGQFSTKQLVKEIIAIDEWSNKTLSGDINELSTIQEDSAIWPHVTSTVDNCLSVDCQFYKECFVVKARQEALSSDIVIVNHHLFFADMAIQKEGFGELLPGTDVVIFDEAHHLPDTASYFFSTVFSSRQLVELARDSEAEGLKTALDMKEIYDISGELQRAVQAMRTALGLDIRTMNWPPILPTHLKNAMEAIQTNLKKLEEVLKIASVRSKGLESCWQRTNDLIERFDLLTKTNTSNSVHWIETHLQSFTLHLTPLIVAEYFKNYMQDNKRSWIFTSATLTVKNNFNLFIETLGLENAMTLQLESPFNYSEQALLYVPRGLPSPNTPSYLEALLNAAIPLLEATKGKTFLLFTSHKALQEAAEYLKDRIDFPILQQGSKPKRQLIEDFKTLGNAILLGTSSFWYGVDVRGEALSCVIIDKLPFSAPDDPILQAKIKMLKEQGLDPFRTLQLPQAILTLKQGAGRLIRDIHDRGVLMIGDPRLVGNAYGGIFLQSLPNMKRTREISEVLQFLNNSDAT